MTNKEAKRLKEEELKILDYFVEFCKKNNLEYQLTFGTLLGAIRHKGFIPWDDDIDVHMTPSNYQKFLQLIKKEIKEDYLCQNLDTEKYYHALFTKIRKNNTCMVEKEWQYIKIHKGINIDIFPLFPYPKNQLEQKKFKFKYRLASLLVSKNNKTTSIKNKIIFGILRVIPRKITNNIANKIIYNMLNYKKEYEHYILDLLNNPIKKELIEESIDTKFENRVYKIPKQYDEILTVLYGDYMTPLKEEDRTGHGEIILSFDKNYEDITE